MITLTLGQLVNSVEALRVLQDTKLPVKTSYWISKLINNQVERELKVYDAARNKLITEYGEAKADGNIQVKPENIKEFTTKLQELLDMPIELDWKLIPISDLGDIQIESKNLPVWIFE